MSHRKDGGVSSYNSSNWTYNAERVYEMKLVVTVTLHLKTQR